jgi:2-(1,2-epoxy-1,2-dihydrophenyl)acetyl-CoA isomerase
MDQEVLCSHREGATLVLEMNRPGKRNALSRDLRTELLEALRAAVDDGQTRAVVLCGAGGHFSAGGDLDDMEVASLEAGRARFDLSHALIRQMIAGPVPVIAAVEGWAVGAGMSLALAADWVVMARPARLAASFGKVGLIGDLGIAHSLPQRIGAARSRQLLLSNATLTAQEALQMGVCDHLAEEGQALARALRCAAPLAAGAPRSAATTKALMAPALDAVLAVEREAQAQLFLTADHAEGKAAFRARRVPNFKGN